MRFGKPLLFCFLLGALIFNQGFSQDDLTMKLARIALVRDRSEIKIGDSLPPIPPLKVVQSNSAQISLEDFKGRAIILDFWHQYCPTCIQTFAKLESFQRGFKDSLVVIPVTFQSEKSILDFLAKRKSIGMPVNLPSIVEDTLLRKYFPHLEKTHKKKKKKKKIIKKITDEK